MIARFVEFEIFSGFFVHERKGLDKKGFFVDVVVKSGHSATSLLAHRVRTSCLDLNIWGRNGGIARKSPAGSERICFTEASCSSASH